MKNRILLKPNKSGRLHTAYQVPEDEIKRLLESGQVQLIDPKTLVYKMTGKTDIPHTYFEDDKPETVVERPRTYETRELRAEEPERPKRRPQSRSKKRYTTKTVESAP
jgi:hypothetical protein